MEGELLTSSFVGSDVYDQLVELCGDLFSASFREKLLPGSRAMDNFTKRVVLIGVRVGVEAPDGIVLAYNKFRATAMRGEDSVEEFGRFLMAMRKDVRPGTACSEADVTQTFLAPGVTTNVGVGYRSLYSLE